MNTSCIRIRWAYSTEYIDIGLGRLPEPGTALDTGDYWHDERELVRYRARCKSAALQDDLLILELSYDANDNPKVVGKCNVWGVTELRINLRTKDGKAFWSDYDDKTRNGKVNCHVLEGVIFDDVSYGTKQAISRPGQSLTQRVLLDMFGCCALTGEKTEAVLDVAHLNAAKDGGSASIANCILLRTDVHRLLDRQLLSIDAFGKVSLKRNVSDRYRQELTGKSLAPAVMQHVRETLIRLDDVKRN
jgi:hypothetical protein